MESVITLQAKVYITLQALPDTLLVLYQLLIVLPVRLWNIIYVLIVAVLAMVSFPCLLDQVLSHSIKAMDEFSSFQRLFCDLCWFDLFAVILPAATAPQVVHIFTIPITIGHRKEQTEA